MIIGLIPARLKSKRLPNKPIRILNGLPIIEHVIRRAQMSKKLDKIVVCADDTKIIKVAKSLKVDTILTSKKIKNGTERICHYLKKNTKLINKIKLVVDIQCDEVFLNPKYLDKVVNFHLNNLKKFNFEIPHSLSKKKKNINYVKIISNEDGKVLYLSRSDTPHNFRTNFESFKRHQDFITFKPKFLTKFEKLKNRKLEKYEGVELLRAIENNYNVGTIFIPEDTFSINTYDDFKKAESILKKSKIRKLY